MKEWAKNRKQPSSTVFQIRKEDRSKAIKAKKKGKCDICRKNKRLWLDHCHKTKKFRGTICFSCNLGLGHFRDSSALLRKAISYLRKTK